MNIKKKLILTFIYSILWFFLCEATKNTGNIIVFRIVSFSLPIVILLWLVYAFFKLFTFIKRQKYSESRHLIKQLDILIDQRNQKIQSIIYEPYNENLYPIIDSIALDNKEIQQITLTDNYHDFQERYKKYAFERFFDGRRTREKMRSLGTTKVKRIHFYIDNKLNDYYSEIIKRIDEYIITNLTTFRTDLNFQAQLDFLCNFEEKLDFPRELIDRGRHEFISTYKKLCGLISDYINNVDNFFSLKNDSHFETLSLNLSFFEEHLFLCYPMSHRMDELTRIKENCFLSFYSFILDSIIDCIKNRKLITELPDFLNYIENSLSIYSPKIYEYKRNLFNEYYNQMLNANYLSSELEYILFCLFKIFNYTESIIYKEEVRVINDYISSQKLQEQPLQHIAEKIPAGMNPNEFVFYFEQEAGFYKTRSIGNQIYEPVGDGEECQIYLTNQRLVIWKSPVMSINLNTIINTTITENKYFIFSVHNRVFPYCLELLQPRALQSIFNRLH
ncbi:MAG: hypothetical protein J5747_11490 [Spirochaetaceae bacterium]|nr:hypothetical protein [Spirochaetaceae bacterium]